MRKVLSLAFVIILAISSMLWVGSATAQSIPKPAIPESFQISFSSHPYDVAPKTTIDPYTGETVITEGGYHNENKTVELTIKNQPFNPYTDTAGHPIGLYYKINFKGHYTDDWSEYFQPLPASNAEYTVLSISSNVLNAPNSGRIDFRIQAGIGYVTSSEFFMGGYIYTLNGETSDWSAIQTIDIPTIASTPAPTNSLPQPTPNLFTPSNSTLNPTATSIQNNAQSNVTSGLSWEQIVIVVMAAVIAVLAVGLAVLWSKLPRKQTLIKP